MQYSVILITTEESYPVKLNDEDMELYVAKQGHPVGDKEKAEQLIAALYGALEELHLEEDWVKHYKENEGVNISVDGVDYLISSDEINFLEEKFVGARVQYTNLLK